MPERPQKLKGSSLQTVPDTREPPEAKQTSVVRYNLKENDGVVIVSTANIMPSLLVLLKSKGSSAYYRTFKFLNAFLKKLENE